MREGRREGGREVEVHKYCVQTLVYTVHGEMSVVERGNVNNDVVCVNGLGFPQNSTTRNLVRKHGRSC